MRYWTLFTLRMMARVGLATVVMLWAVGQWGPHFSKAKFGGMNLYVEIEKTEVDVLWCPSQYADTFESELRGLPPLNLNNVPIAETVTIPGVTARVRGLQFFVVYFDHWLLCLTFLIATVATSWRRKKPIVDNDRTIENRGAGSPPVMAPGVVFGPPLGACPLTQPAERLNHFPTPCGS